MRLRKRPLATSRLTNNGQVVVPAVIRKRLNLKPGDRVIFEEAEAGSIRLRKAKPLDVEFLSALEGTLSEWNSENDDRTYRDL